MGKHKAIRGARTANGEKTILMQFSPQVIGQNGKLVGYAGGLWREKMAAETTK
ncbi:MAG: hypothetical protein IPM10_09975 [Chitinophagaceae bacterium]|nr:hypothetical protein [Chitinophagaceae bacterium]